MIDAVHRPQLNRSAAASCSTFNLTSNSTELVQDRSSTCWRRADRCISSASGFPWRWIRSARSDDGDAMKLWNRRVDRARRRIRVDDAALIRRRRDKADCSANALRFILSIVRSRHTLRESSRYDTTVKNRPWRDPTRLIFC